MRLDYSLRLNSAACLGSHAWTPAQLFARGQSGALFLARRGLFLDMAGTEPARTPGQPIALMRDLSANANHATQPNPAQRPILGRHPARGVANIYPANTTNLLGWPTTRLTSVTAPESTSGEPAVDLTATEAHPSGAFMRGNLIALTPGTYTLSAIVHGTGWFAMRPTVEAHFADGVFGWFDLGAGVVGDTSAGSGSSVLTTPSAAIEPVGDGYRVALTFTVTDAQPLTMRFYLVDGNASLAVTPDASVRLEAPQLEAGAQTTPYQRRVSQYDITEAGQRSLWYLSADGVDDWMQLAQPFTGGGPFFMAAVHDWQTGWPGPITFGSVSGASLLNLAQGISLTADGSANRVSFGATTGWPSVAAGQNRVDIVQVSSGSQAQAWRNDTAYPASPDITGDITQMDGIDGLFRAGSGYGLGRFYGGVMGSSSLTDAARMHLHRYLAKLGGTPT
ncbi:MAG: hypothetical protein JJT99_10510 [Rhodobacteraceae bacterium]|nr:hypothetical protein [Paracoccaceae bacterium]